MLEEMPIFEDARRRRLWMRSIRRGIKEMDIIFSRYAAAYLQEMDDEALDRYERLLEENDQALFSWINGSEVPPEAFSAIISHIRNAVSEKN